jgi:hypothetical protein
MQTTLFSDLGTDSKTQMLKDYYHLWSNGTRYTRSHHKRITGAIAREKGDNIVRVVLLFRFFALSTFQHIC